MHHVRLVFDGLPEMRYQAKGPGGFASGQIVWTWIAYEEDPSQGKDRPVLLIGAHSGWLLGLPATSQDHDRDAEQERRAGRYWVEIGSGVRPSFLQTYSSTEGSILAKVPTAPEIAQVATSARAAIRRVLQRLNSA